jgi:phosphoribosylaminoimidazole carboxylase (NCAIR synthetase)
VEQRKKAITHIACEANMMSNSLPADRPLRVGCVGGGQLGRMMALEAPRIGISMKFLDPLGTNCPAAQVVPSDLITQGSLKDPAAIHALVQDCDVVTVEIEHVGVDTLHQLEKEGVNVQPSARVLGIVSDKYVQKVRSDDVVLGCGESLATQKTFIYFF